MFRVKLLKNIPVQNSDESIYTSAQYSAWIEGITNSRGILNIATCLEMLAQHMEALKLQDILTFHRTILHNLPGKTLIRTSPAGIFDQTGKSVYIAPPPEELRPMLDILLGKINQRVHPEPSLIRTICAHYYFEKIHPFEDGNGRTGRVILHDGLRKTKMFGEHMLPIDQFLFEHRDQYYQVLEETSRDTHVFVEFMLNGVLWSVNKLIDQSVHVVEMLALLPRREELYAIIKDHPYTTFDMLSRRFPRTPKRTLAYDLAALAKGAFIVKHGVTRGVSYSIRKTES